MNKQDALDALQVWCEGEGEAFPSSREGAEPIWLAAWAARDAEVGRLREALLKYGRHLDDCVFHADDDSDLEAHGPHGVCTCGFYDVLLPVRTPPIRTTAVTDEHARGRPLAVRSDGSTHYGLDDDHSHPRPFLHSHRHTEYYGGSTNRPHSHMHADGYDHHNPIAGQWRHTVTEPERAV